MLAVAETRQIYSKPPIVEAVIDLRCVNPPAFSLRDLTAAVEKLSSQKYTDAGETVEVTQTIGSDGSSQRTEKKVGLAMRSADEKFVVQLQVSGFTLSRLHPYDRWETFIAEAQQLWESYATVANPERIRRVGVRYVNRLEIGSPGIDDLHSFLQLHPVTPWGLSTPPASFFLQIKQPRPDGSILVVNESAVEHMETGQAAIVLDLDCFGEVDLPRDDTALWNLVAALHVTVEDAFEASITDKVRLLIR